MKQISKPSMIALTIIAIQQYYFASTIVSAVFWGLMILTGAFVLAGILARLNNVDRPGSYLSLNDSETNRYETGRKWDLWLYSRRYKPRFV